MLLKLDISMISCGQNILSRPVTKALLPDPLITVDIGMWTLVPSTVVPIPMPISVVSFCPQSMPVPTAATYRSFCKQLIWYYMVVRSSCWFSRSRLALSLTPVGACLFLISFPCFLSVSFFLYGYIRSHWYDLYVSIDICALVVWLTSYLSNEYRVVPIINQLMRIPL